jgi:hypothetical protein
MSIELSDNLSKQFESEVHHAFQSMGKLRDSVRVKNVKGNQVQFPVMDKGAAVSRGATSTSIPLMDVAYTPVTATLANYTASELTDIFENGQVSFDEREELVKVIAGALARRMDQIIIDALDASSTTNTVANNISGSIDNLTLAAIREAARMLDAGNVAKDERTLVIHASGLHNLLADSQVTSSDFSNIKALVDGNLDTFYGFKVITIGDMAEGGLPLATADRTNYAFAKDALGVGINLEKVEVNYEPAYGAWRTTGFLSAGADAIDGSGIVQITTDES